MCDKSHDMILQALWYMSYCMCIYMYEQRRLGQAYTNMQSRQPLLPAHTM